ncbi:MAG TPA: hypothetical protein VH681_13070 [Nitrospiraceae bacterium]|jgi:hypothetical protein
MVMPSMEHHEEISAGIVVLSSTLKALYMNEAAQEILSRLTRTESERARSGMLPRSANDLLVEMLPFLRAAGADDSWRQQRRRLITAGDQSVLVKTFGIPNRTNVRQPLIVLILSRNRKDVAAGNG